jgi:hypothetical protein
VDLDEEHVYAKERRLIEEIQSELAMGRKVQVFAVYTQKRDITRRLEALLVKSGIRAEVLTAETPPEQREAWYERQLKGGIEVCICHPKLVQTGLDLLSFPTIFFVQTGYSIYTLRQASRRSWRIGQKEPVRVAFFTYVDTAQERCLRLMGKKLLVSLALEGKLQAEGLQAIDPDEDLLTAMARELVTRQGVGEEAAEVWRVLTKIRETSAGASIIEGSPAAARTDTGKVPEEPKASIPSKGPAVQLSLF